MTNERAIEILNAYKQRLDESCSNLLDNDKEAFRIAIKALEDNDRLLSVSNDVRRILRGEE